METKIYYLPRNAIAKFAIEVVARNIPCSFSDVDEMVAAQVIKYRIICLRRDIPAVERILKGCGLLD